MDSRFKIAETVTTADWEAFSACAAGHKMGKVFGTALRAAPTVQGTTDAFLGIILMGTGAFILLCLFMLPEMKEIFPLIIFMGGSFLFFGIRSFRRKRNSTLSDIFSRAGIVDTPMQFSFEEDAFFVLETGSSSSYRYHALSDIWEDEDRFYLFISGKIQFILQKGAFVLGNPNDFSPFLSQKISRPVTVIK